MKFWQRLIHRGRRDQELDEEIQSHFRMAVQDRLERGESAGDARHAARREFGNVGLVKETTREIWGWASLERLAQDLRYAARVLRASPGFTTVAALTLALGIGANTAIFSVVRAALLPLDVPEPERVVMVWTENAKRDWHQFPASVPDFLDWKASGVFSSLGALTQDGFNVRLGGETLRLSGMRVNGGFFDALSRKAQLGRVFTAQDTEAGHSQTVILSDGLWRSRFRADRSVVGKSLVVDGTPHTIVGVLQKTFPRLSHEEIYLPLVFQPPLAAERGSRFFVVMGRLASGIDPPAAQHRMTELSRLLDRRYHDDDAGNTVVLQPVEAAFVQDSQALLFILFGTVGIVLLIACANIANLLLARGTARAKEMAIRAALGAGRWRLSRQLLTESVLLAALGGVLGVLPALWGIHFISTFHLEDLPNADQIAFDWAVVAFDFGLSLATGMLFGLVPAWQAWRTDINYTLKAATGSHGVAFHQRLRGLFVVSEVALTMVLLVVAALVLQSYQRMRSAWPGYQSQGLVTMRIALSDHRYDVPEKQAAFFDRVLGRVAALPGVSNAAAIDEIPTSDDLHGSGLFFPDRPAPRTEDIPVVLRDSVTSDYFRAMRIPLLRGRYFNASDRKDSAPVVVVDEWAARRYWPNQNPIGKRVKVGLSQPPREIVGVVGSIDQSLLVRMVKGRVGQVYLPMAQAPRPAMSLVVRASGDAGTEIGTVRRVVRGLDIDQPVFDAETMEQARASGRTSQRLAAWVLGAFALVALLLATVGIYGVVAYNVGQRTREFGIRISLGAEWRDILGNVLRQGAVLAAIGIAIGLAGAFALTRLLESLLYGVAANDPLTFFGVAGLLAAVALAASYLPARRAIKIDPVRALRFE